MPLRLEKHSVRRVPFHGNFLRYRLGYVLNEKNERCFRYTRSLELVRNAFRVTLQLVGEEDRPFIFDLLPNSETSDFEILPDNDLAKEVWKNRTPEQRRLADVLELILNEDLRKPDNHS